MLILERRCPRSTDKRFNNSGYSLFFLMGIFLKYLWLIPNILKWENCKIFTKLVPLQNPSTSSDRSCSVRKGNLKNLQNWKGKHLRWSLFQTLLKRDSNTVWLFICCKTKLKKKFFFWKNICFLQNIHYLQKKCFYMEKKFYIEFFFTEKKLFLQREKYKSKCKNIYISFENIFLCRKCLCYK